MSNNNNPSLRDWNKLSEVQPELKPQPNSNPRSDYCWILLKDGSINEAQYFVANNKCTFGYKENLITHWAYRDIAPPMPKDFKPKKIDYALLSKR